ncbi:MAG: alpha-mannosidase [Planctomycetes bacterium]|nr:alpha-mannosidase [Planctomycetota bacterium]
MTLNAEWRDRLDAWRNELKRHLYRPLGAVALEGWFTRDHLDAAAGAAGPFAAAPAGTAWGGAYEYGWFRGCVTVPSEAAGERIVAHLPVTDKEALVWVNGELVEPYRGTWPHITLTARAAGGERFDILMEAYAWHGPTPCHVGPIPPDRPSVPQPRAAQQTVGECTFGVWNETAWQLLMDVGTLVNLRDTLDADSLRVSRIDDALKQFTRTVDFEQPFDAMQAAFQAARGELAGVLACRNGSTSPEFFCFGHAHLDVAWLWPLAETERKAVRTLAGQLALAEQYPGYRFLHSQPHLFWMIKNRYPAFYERVRRAVADGHIIAEGGMWVEADTNISGGEALIRQFLAGKRFFADEFGVDSEMLWLPDVFGYSAALPQIMAGCGIKYFSTQKIFWNYHGGDTFPYHNFLWEGIDGSTVITHLHNDYNAPADPGAVIKRWTQRVQKDGMSTRMYPFGWGDGGGGPTREHLEYIARLGDCEGVPKLELAGPVAFFEDLVARGEHDANRWVGELYFTCHRGTLTSQARTKWYNRRCEQALREAELWASFADGYPWPAETLEDTWRAVLLNQFHDILPGSSIQRVYEQAEASYAEALATADGIAEAAMGALVNEAADALTVFNSLNWSRTALVALPAGAAGAADAAGEPVVTQTVGGATLAAVTVPSCGWTTLKLTDTPAAATAGGVTVTGSSLANDRIRATFNALGEMVSLIDLADGREVLAAGRGNVMKMYKDVPSKFDAWDIDSMVYQTPVDLGEAPATFEVVTQGPLVGVLRITRRINNSTLTQDVTLRAGSARLDFVTTLDWHERHRLLKVGFSGDVRATEAIHEIQFGHLRRPNHTNRQADRDQFEVCNHKGTALAEPGRGLAVLNDSKYGVNVAGTTINLTLMRAPLGPDGRGDAGRYTFTYALLAWTGGLADSSLVREAYDLNIPVRTRRGDGGTRSVLAADAPGVVVEAVKLAADGSGDVIVRLYEAHGTAASCMLSTDLPVVRAARTDMLERNGRPLAVKDGAVALAFRPFEIKTVRLTS